MLNSSLIEIIRTFSKDEIKKFDEMVNSPYFNKKSAVLKFWNIINKYSPEFSTTELKREAIYSKIFPGKEFNYGTMNNLIFDLSRLVEKFLSYEKLDKDKFQFDLYFLNQLLERSLGRLFNIKYNETEKRNKKLSGHYKEYYLNLSKLTSIKRNYEFIRSLKEIDYYDFDKTSEYLIYYFLVQLFAEFNNSIAGRIMANKSGAASLLEKFLTNINLERVISIIKKISEEDYQRLLFSYKKYLAIAHADKPEYYFDYKKYLTENLNYLTKEEKYNNTNALLTALSELQIDSHLKSKEYTEIDKFRVRNNLVLTSDGLSPIIYSGIIRNAGRLKDHEFVKEFMDSYHEKLPEEYKVNMKNFSLAYLNFAKNDYNKSLEYLSKIDFDIFQFKFYVKNLQMVLYYEVRDYVGFSYVKDSYKHFLLNNKLVSQRDKELYANLVKYIELLFNVSESQDEVDTEFLKKNLLNEKTVGMKSWLLEKVEELLI